MLAERYLSTTEDEDTSEKSGIDKNLLPELQGGQGTTKTEKKIRN